MEIDPSKIKHIHLIAICGTGMGALAGLLREKGYTITGSDQNIYPPMSEELEQRGITLCQGYRPENLTPAPDLVIVGNAVSKNNPEVERLLESKLPYLSMPQALSQFFISGKTSIVVSGTHGKTTTSALISHLLNELGSDPSFFVGGVSLNFQKNFQIGKGNYFVIEGDEYDTAFFDKGPKFLHYQPCYTIITSLEFDHADIYRDLDHLTQSFVKLIDIMPPQGLLLACNLYPRLIDCIKQSRAPVQTYGLDASAEWSIQNLSYTTEGTTTEIWRKKNKETVLSIPLAGKHNALNALSAYALLRNLGFESARIGEALQNFKGVKRRQELIGMVKGITVIDDFAHHPTAVFETIQAVKNKYRGSSLWALFEPRSNTSKRALFQKEYAEAFKGADQVLIADVFMPEKVTDGTILDVERLSQDIERSGTPSRHISGIDSIVNFVVQNITSPAVVLIMSNGGFGGIPQKMLRALKE